MRRVSKHPEECTATHPFFKTSFLSPLPHSNISNSELTPGSQFIRLNPSQGCFCLSIVWYWYFQQRKNSRLFLASFSSSFHPFALQFCFILLDAWNSAFLLSHVGSFICALSKVVVSIHLIQCGHVFSFWGENSSKGSLCFGREDKLEMLFLNVENKLVVWAGKTDGP